MQWNNLYDLVLHGSVARNRHLSREELEMRSIFKWINVSTVSPLRNLSLPYLFTTSSLVLVLRIFRKDYIPTIYICPLKKEIFRGTWGPLWCVCEDKFFALLAEIMNLKRECKRDTWNRARRLRDFSSSISSISNAILRMGIYFLTERGQGVILPGTRQ